MRKEIVERRDINALDDRDIFIISEIKKASPSAGILVKDFNHLNIAKLYVDNGATCLSVLTEEDLPICDEQTTDMRQRLRPSQ